MKDPYTYDDGTTLKNKHGIKDFEILSSLEENITNTKKHNLPQGNFDYTHLKAIHQHLFGSLYDWAGQERTVTTIKNGVPYAAPHLIEKEANNLFKKLKNDNFLQNLSQEDFCYKASEYFNEINAIHPFREGNSRTNGAFFDLLAEKAGYTITWENFDKLDYTKAKMAGHCALDYQPLYDLIYANTSKITSSLDVTNALKDTQLTKAQVMNEIEQKYKYLDNNWQSHMSDQSFGVTDFKGEKHRYPSTYLSAVAEDKSINHLIDYDSDIGKEIEKHIQTEKELQSDLELDNGLEL